MAHDLFVKSMVENSARGLPTSFDHGREFPRDYTYCQDVAQIAQRALLLPADEVRDRVFFAATGRPLVTAGEVAEVVREQVPGAQIEIASGLSREDHLEIRYRGVLSIENAREQLGFEPEYGEIGAGVADYLSRYRRYWSEQR